MKVFELKLNEQSAQTILNALAEMPFKTSASVIQEIMQQVQKQQQESQPPVAPAEDSTKE